MLEQAHERNSMLKGIILSKSNKEAKTVLDSTITGKFTNLRDDVQRLVARYFELDPEYLPKALSFGNASTLQQYLHRLWELEYTDYQMQDRARVMIFRILLDHLLNTPCFGFTSTEDQDMETALARFEEALYRKSDNKQP
jgi:hypothetical protein